MSTNMYTGIHTRVGFYMITAPITDQKLITYIWVLYRHRHSPISHSDLNFISLLLQLGVPFSLIKWCPSSWPREVCNHYPNLFRVGLWYAVGFGKHYEERVYIIPLNIIELPLPVCLVMESRLLGYRHLCPLLSYDVGCSPTKGYIR